MPGSTDRLNNKYREIIATHSDLIRNMCVARSRGDEVLTRDLIHECYLAIWNRLGGLREDSHMGEKRMWVVWQCRSVFLRQKSKKIKSLMTIMGGDLVDQAANGYETNSNSELIQELSADLSSHEHELLNLILQGYNTSEMADIMGIKAASVSVERNRIIKKMRLRAEKNGKR